MTSSETCHCRAGQIIARLAALLDEGRLAETIDDPIDAITQEVIAACRGHSPRERLHRAASALVRKLYEKAIPCRRILSPSQARDEAISILEREYRGAHADGYFGALADAADPSQDGVALVLTGMAEAIKHRERRRYARWAMARLIDPADWELRRALAARLLDNCRRWLPPELRDCTPDQFADSVPDLLAIALAADAHLTRLGGEATNPLR